MLCYTHPANQAVATCKNCNKGVCLTCAIELEGGIACSEHCAENVKMINAMINRNKKMPQRTAATYYRNAFIYFGFAFLFIISAFMYSFMQTYMAIGATIFIVGAVSMLVSARRINTL